MPSIILLIRWRFEQSFHKSLHWTDISFPATERVTSERGKKPSKIHLDFEKCTSQWSARWHNEAARKYPRWTVYNVSPKTIDVHNFTTQSATASERPSRGGHGLGFQIIVAHLKSNNKISVQLGNNIVSVGARALALCFSHRFRHSSAVSLFIFQLGGCLPNRQLLFVQKTAQEGTLKLTWLARFTSFMRVVSRCSWSSSSTENNCSEITLERNNINNMHFNSN